MYRKKFGKLLSLLLTLVVLLTQLPLSIAFAEGEGGDGQVVFFDDFEGGAVNWSFSGDVWSVTGEAGTKQFMKSTTAGDYFATLNKSGSSSWTDYSVEADITVLNRIGPGVNPAAVLNVRYVNGNNRYGFSLKNSSVCIRKKSGGSDVEIVTAPLPDIFKDTDGFLKRNRQYHVKGMVIGNKLEMWVDGLKVLEFIDDGTSGGPILTSGTISLSNHGMEVLYDNVKVTDYTTPLAQTNITFDDLVAAKEAAMENEIDLAVSGSEYSATVEYEVSEIYVQPLVTTGAAITITIDGQNVTSGSVAGPLALEVGENVFPMAITEEGKSPKEFTLAVTRSSGTPEAPDEYSFELVVTKDSELVNEIGLTDTESGYSAIVGYEVSGIYIQPAVTTTGGAIAITIDGQNVSNGAVTGPIALEIGENAIPIAVTVDGEPQEELILSITRRENTYGHIMLDEDFEDGASNWTRLDGGWSVVDTENSKQYEKDNDFITTTIGFSRLNIDYESPDGIKASEWTDYSVEADVTIMGTGDGPRSEISARFTSHSIRYAFTITNSGLQIRKRNGTEVTLASTSNLAFTPELGRTYHVKGELVGNTLRMYVDGIKELEVVDTGSVDSKAPLVSGTVCLNNYKASVRYDNVKVVDLTNPPPAPPEPEQTDLELSSMVIAEDAALENSISAAFNDSSVIKALLPSQKQKLDRDFTSSSYTDNSYLAKVPYNVSSVYLKPEVDSSEEFDLSILTIDGEEISNGEDAALLQLTTGTNVFVIAIAQEEKLARYYAVVISRANSVDISVNPREVLVQREGNNPVGLCLSYVTDTDDFERTYTMTDVVNNNNFGSIRWPMGTLAMYYNWNSKDAEGNFNYPVQPRYTRPTYMKNNFPWAVADDIGEIPQNEMDIDEFIDVAKNTGSTPTIVINMLGDVYPDATTTYEELKELAVEQVRYFKEQGITGAYWEMGNEVEHVFVAANIPGTTEAQRVQMYIDRCLEIAPLIKEVDPTARVGVGLNLAAQKNNWHIPVMSAARDDMDFIVTHQYGGHNFSGAGISPNYEGWLSNDYSKGSHAIQKVNLISSYIDEIANLYGEEYRNKFEILVTEYSSHRSGDGWMDTSGGAMYLALHSFEILAEMMNHPRIGPTHFWLTRTPWSGGSIEALEAYTALQNDHNALLWDGSFTPQGQAIAVMSSNIYDTMVKAESDSYKVGPYATYDTGTGALTVFILNRENNDVEVDFILDNYSASDFVSAYVFEGINGSQYDTQYKYEEIDSPELQGNGLSMTLHPASVTVLKFTGNVLGEEPGEEPNPTPTPTPTLNAVPALQIKTNPDGSSSVEVVKPSVNSEGKAIINIDGSTLTSALEKAAINANGKKKVEIIVPEAAGAVTYELGIPAGLLQEQDATGEFEFKTGIANVTMPSNMLNTSGTNVSLSITAVDNSTLSAENRAAIGNKPVVQLNLYVDGSNVSWNNPNAPVIISIPYTPTADEDPEKITVWYIDGNGNVVPVYDGRYDAATGMVVFKTTHFSEYAVVYVNTTFEDIADYSWARKSIEVLASKGIITSTSAANKLYNPSANITRADFIVLLVKALGLTAEVESSFIDVKSSDYFYKEVGIAKKLGVTNGVGRNMFAPGAGITRQEMMAMTARALKSVHKLVAEGTAADLSKFEDAALVAPFAVGNTATLVKEGLIAGSGNKLNPTKNTTRAEAAVLMYRIYNKQ